MPTQLSLKRLNRLARLALNEGRYSALSAAREGVAKELGYANWYTACLACGDVRHIDAPIASTWRGRKLRIIPWIWEASDVSRVEIAKYREWALYVRCTDRTYHRAFPEPIYIDSCETVRDVVAACTAILEDGTKLPAYWQEVAALDRQSPVERYWDFAASRVAAISRASSAELPAACKRPYWLDDERRIVEFGYDEANPDAESLRLRKVLDGWTKSRADLEREAETRA